MKIFVVSFVLILISQLAHSAQLTEEFSSRQVIESATLVFNQSKQALHPTLRVNAYGDGTQSMDFEVSAGEDGSFNPNTYASFSVGDDLSGNIIRIDTDQFPILKVTSFQLDAGWILEPVGTNPLVIHSLGDVIIEGEIWCHGGAGGDGVGPSPGAGGASRCGGGAGGNGGALGADGVNGQSTGPAVTGGQGGNFTGGAAVGGGGGGSWNTTSSPGNGANSSMAGGQAGSSTSEPDFATFAGGAGGGGGSGTTTDAGAGGGAGGGVVIINAVGNVSVGSSGRIRASGGLGGSSNVPGGAGGGGGGGSIRVFSGQEVSILNPDASGAVRAELGGGGTNSLGAVTAGGGVGRNWFTSVTDNFVGSYTPSEEFPFAFGAVEYATVPQELITNSYDLKSTRLQLVSLTTNPASPDFSFEVSGSNDNFVSDNRGWTSDIASIKDKRYLKLKIILANTNPSTPTLLDSVTIDYTALTMDEFEFVSTGCGVVTAVPPPNLSFLILILLPLLCLLIRRPAQS